jgi:hypothetical protein
MLRQLPTMSLLWYLDTSENRLYTDWPSWVPDWRSRILPPIASFTIQHSIWGNTGHDEIVYDASFRIDVTRQRLTVMGIPLSCIEAVARVQERPIYDERLARLLEEFKLCYTLRQLYEFSFDTPESRVEALWRTMIMNFAEDSGSTPPPEEWKGMFYAHVVGAFSEVLLNSGTELARHEVLEALDGFYSHFAEELIAEEIPPLWEVQRIATMIPHLGTSPTVEAELRPISERATQFQNTLWQRGNKRQRFRAKNGMLGSGMKLARPGDQIWLLQRMNTPVLLRPEETPDQFKIVGECYLHGCMNGELFSHGYLDRNSAKQIVIV